MIAALTQLEQLEPGFRGFRWVGRSQIKYLSASGGGFVAVVTTLGIFF